MGTWIAARGDFIAADVIRWREGVFERRGRRGRSVRLGERSVIAEILSEPDGRGLIRLLVRGGEALDETPGRSVPPLKIGTEIRRAKKTLLRGNPERLLWSDESARALVASKFLNDPREMPGPRS